jgi:hypothetical protein
MSRPARGDKATGRLSVTRHAAALSGIGIRAGARIAAGALPGNCQLRKGSTWESHSGLDPYAINSPCRGLRASALSHSDASSRILPGLMRPAVEHPRPPRDGLGRQPLHDARCYGIDALETHHSRSRFAGWRASPWAHDGTQGNTRLLPLDGASPRPRKRPVILPSQASEAVTFHLLNFSRRPTSARTGLRDPRNVVAPRFIPKDAAGAFDCRSRNF